MSATWDRCGACGAGPDAHGLIPAGDAVRAIRDARESLRRAPRPVRAGGLAVGDRVEVSPGAWRTVTRLAYEARLGGRFLVVSVSWADDEMNAAPGRYPGSEVLNVLPGDLPDTDETEASE